MILNANGYGASHDPLGPMAKQFWPAHALCVLPSRAGT